jgi:hypothetical protein
LVAYNAAVSKVSNDGKPERDDSAPAGMAAEAHVRRESGARLQVSEPVVFRGQRGDVQGWALNISRGGLRAVVDGEVAVGDHFEVHVGEWTEPRAARVVWVKPDKGGGCIVGLAFDDAGSAAPPPPPTTMPPPETSAPAMPNIPVSAPLPADEDTDS